jgi:phosphatidylglycerol:prolipoprotein diacylglycerol transferase
VLPVLFESSFFTLYTYPLFIGLSWGFAYFFTLDIFKENQKSLDGLNWLYIGVFVSSWIGAKLFFLFFSAQDKIHQYFYANYFWLGGGFVFFGGLIFGVIYFVLYSKLFKKFDINNSHLLLPGLAFSHAIGRVGCFLTGCCYGSLASTTFGIKFHGENRYPVQIYEAIGLVFLALAILIAYFATYSVLRFFLEFFRGDEIRGMYLGLSSSQHISVFIFICCIIYKLYKK